MNANVAQPQIIAEQLIERFPRFYLAIEITYRIEDQVTIVLHDLAVTQLQESFTSNDIASIKINSWNQVKQIRKLPENAVFVQAVIINSMFLGHSTDTEFSQNQAPLEKAPEAKEGNKA